METILSEQFYEKVAKLMILKNKRKEYITIEDLKYIYRLYCEENDISEFVSDIKELNNYNYPKGRYDFETKELFMNYENIKFYSLLNLGICGVNNSIIRVFFHELEHVVQNKEINILREGYSNSYKDIPRVLFMYAVDLVFLYFLYSKDTLTDIGKKIISDLDLEYKTDDELMDMFKKKYRTTKNFNIAERVAVLNSEKKSLKVQSTVGRIDFYKDSVNTIRNMNKMGYTTESGIQVCPAYNFLKSINLGDYIAYIESLINEYSDELTNERRLLYGLPIDPNYLEEVSKDNTPKRILK